ncbi:MAG: V-type ATPase 116kDa subunit family protein [Thermodesulfobacteriota bacterium]
MIKEMSKLQIIGPRSLLDECIRALHALSVLHIETVPVESVTEGILKRLPLEVDKVKEKDFFERAFERIKNLLFLLTVPAAAAPAEIAPEKIKEFLEELRPVEDEVRALHARKEELTEELSGIEKYEKVLRGFAPVVSRLGGLKNFDILGLTMDRTRQDVLSLLEGELEKITSGKYEIYTRPVDEATLGVVIAYPKKFAERVRYLVLGEGINEIRLPGEYEDIALIEAITRMTRRKEEIPGLVGRVEGDIASLSTRWYGVVEGLRNALQDAIDEIGVLPYCAETKFCFVIEGWAPKDMTSAMKEEFGNLFKGKVLVRELEIKAEEEEIVPVYIKNPRWLKPFEVFIRAMPTPRYRSVDPTPYIALFFPAFFGLIVGDVGYGLIILALGLYLRRRFRERETLRDFFEILSVCGITAVIFGVLFGELFGDLGETLGIMHPILFDRMRALTTFMVLSLGIGFGHVVLGLLIGIVNYMHRGMAREAVGKFSYLVLVVSSVMLIGISMKYLPEGLMTPGLVVLVVSFVVLVAVEGLIGPLELVRAIGNILSYVRIMAVGTASVVMAVAANKVAGLTGSLFVGIIAALLIHLLNLFLSILSPTIQSMRLQYVEFLSKFYEGGGRRYEPFKKR